MKFEAFHEFDYISFLSASIDYTNWISHYPILFYDQLKGYLYSPVGFLYPRKMIIKPLEYCVHCTYYRIYIIQINVVPIRVNLALY